MRSPELFLVYPLLCIFINIGIIIIDKVSKLSFKYFLILNTFTLLSIILFWFPFTIVPNNQVGLEGYSILIVSLSIIFFTYKIGLNFSSKSTYIIPIVILTCLLCYVLFWYLKYPPYGNDMVKYKYYETLGIQTQSVINFIVYFVTFGLSLVIFIFKQFLKK